MPGTMATSSPTLSTLWSEWGPVFTRKGRRGREGGGGGGPGAVGGRENSECVTDNELVLGLNKGARTYVILL